MNVVLKLSIKSCVSGFLLGIKFSRYLKSLLLDSWPQYTNTHTYTHIHTDMHTPLKYEELQVGKTELSLHFIKKK